MKKLLLAILIVCVFVLPVFAEYQAPPVSNKDIIDLVETFGFRVRIPVEQVHRSLSFYKLEEGKKLSDDKIKLLSEDEKVWYEQGYIVEYGEWIGDEEKEKDQVVQTAIYGSGSIIYSNILPEALQSKEKEIIIIQSTYSTYSSPTTPLQVKERGMYAETLGMTNYHVVQPLVDKLSLGSQKAPLNVYEEKDIKTTIDPPTVTIREGARPIQQKYSYLVDREGKPLSWLATTNTAQIQINIDQNYTIEGTVVAYDKGLDVGIISIKNVAYQPYTTFRQTECQVGEKIWIVHCPLALMKSIDRGYVNQTHLDLGIDSDGLGWNDQVKLDIPLSLIHI